MGSRIWDLRTTRLTRKDSKLAVAEWKTGEALHLLIQFHNFVGQPGDLVTKARVFDETVAKALPITRAKVINIVVDYSSKMETLLAEMRKLMVGLHSATLQPGALDLSKFPEIPAAEILHGLSTPTKATGRTAGSPSLPVGPGLDARTRPADGQPPEN